LNRIRETSSTDIIERSTWSCNNKID
jgi:hypothetical protein